ncbi:MAG TPA: hypothetical protein VFO44_11310 [Steroidobacteraceae bacterium]|nr:hypothetical protein [Steroidobacteraceae bacterium]
MTRDFVGRPDRPASLAVAAFLAGALLTLVCGCSHLPRPHWPWQHRQAQTPQAVHELDVSSAGGGAEVNLPQYWKGNTLVVDLQPAGSSGQVIMKPRAHTLWPVRIAFRVMPGQFGALEVRARQRVVLPITPAGAQPIDLELPPGAFVMKSPEMTVTWGSTVAAAQ